jgi:hypothetical protein
MYGSVRITPQPTPNPLYRKLILTAKASRARTKTTGLIFHKKLRFNPKDGDTILKFLYGQQCNGNFAKRYDHAPTDACPLCHQPDSCTHNARECPEKSNHIISRHNAACRLVHAANCTATQGSGAMLTVPELTLVSADTGTQPQTTADIYMSLQTNHEGK